MNNTVTGILRFHPSPKGKIVEGCYAKYKDIIGKVERIAENDRIEIFINDTIQYVDLNKLVLMKLYCLKGSSVVGELSYYDYDKATEGDTVKGHIVKKFSYIYPSEEVYITSFSLRDFVTFDRVLKGVVSSIYKGKYTIVSGNSITTLNRYCIKPANKPNQRNIFYIEKIIEKDD